MFKYLSVWGFFSLSSDFVPFELKLDDSLFCSSGHVTKACDVLRSIEEFKHKAGMVGLNPQ